MRNVPSASFGTCEVQQRGLRDNMAILSWRSSNLQEWCRRRRKGKKSAKEVALLAFGPLSIGRDSWCPPSPNGRNRGIQGLGKSWGRHPHVASFMLLRVLPSSPTGPDRCSAARLPLHPSILSPPLESRPSFCKKKCWKLQGKTPSPPEQQHHCAVSQTPKSMTS